MGFKIPDVENLKAFSKAGLDDNITQAVAEITEIRASVADPEQVTDEQLARLKDLKSFVASAESEIEDRQRRADEFAATEIVAAAPVAEAKVEKTDDVKDVADTTPVTETASTTTTIVAATVTPANTDAAATAAVKTAKIAELAPAVPAVDADGTADAYSIVAASNIATSASNIIPVGQSLSWKDLGAAFVEQTRSHMGMRASSVQGRHSKDLALIRRNFTDEQTLLPGDTSEQAYLKLVAAGKEPTDSLVAANGWCAPSEPDYSICSPITMDGLLNLPERVLRRGGLLHNRGLDFGSFFGDDFTLPIPGYNILTEAEVIADTAKTCVEIPCPAFVDDRLNVAALCLTSSLLQNRGYPEFVSTFVEGAIASMAHLVNREVINAIVTGSVAIDLRTVDPWGTDGTVWSNFLSAVDFAAMDLRYVYRAARTQMVEITVPYWLKQALRADWTRRNATFTDDMTDQMLDAELARRYVRVSWIYDWQDAFNAGAHPVAVPANNQMGDSTPADLFNVPSALSFTAWLPGTWVLGRQDVIRLESVYDSTNLAQNLVTQLFMEDGFLPMRMCQHSRVYTIPICANGSTGVQRAITCTDVTP